MHCSSCGSRVSPGLRFCNACGARLHGADNETLAHGPGFSTESLVWAMVVALLGGLGVTTGLLAVLKNELGFSTELIVMFALVCMALVVATSGSILLVLLRGRANANRSFERDRVAGLAGEPFQPALEAPPLSVVEHTTRNLDPEPVRVRPAIADRDRAE